MSVVTTVQKEIESLKNSIKREKAIESNIFDMTAVIEHIAELKEASEPMAEEVHMNHMRSGKQQQKKN